MKYFHGRLSLVLLSILLSYPVNTMAHTISYEYLQSITLLHHPFLHDLHTTVLPSAQKEAPVMIVCHGYGDNYSLVNYIHEMNVTDHHLIGFNFPDHDITELDDHTKSTFGTIHEILPLLYLLKACVIDLQLTQISLYGFSAGGGAVINTLAALYTNRFDKELKQIGINTSNKQTIMKALQAGMIILDCPLKSIEEIMDFQGKSPEFEALTQNFAHNNTKPLDVLTTLTGIKLTIFLHFQNPDDILGNRDDTLFIERLKSANRGKTIVTASDEGGHNAHHAALWNSVNKHTSF